MNEPIMAQEIQQETVQSLFDKQEILRGQLRNETNAWKEELAEVGEYVELTEKMKAMRDERTAIVDDLKEKSPALTARIEDLKERLKVVKETLNMKVVDELQRGHKVEVIDKLKRKELSPVISVKFQQSLF